MFGKDPASFLPQCRVRITVIPFGKTGSKFSDSLLIEDNLFRAYERLFDYFTKSMPLISDFHSYNWDRSSLDKYPIEALDEAILNAIVHRDYADFSGEVTINIYPEKIEIINSGEFPDNILTGKSQFNDHHSVFRNPTIAHIFWLRVKIEKLGRGLNLIRNRFTEFGLKMPEWITQSGYTKLTLFSEVVKIEMSERMLVFLKNLRAGVSFHRGAYEDFFEGEIHEKTARNDMAKLVKGNWLKKIGSGPSTQYTRTNKELPDIAG